jgi:protein O-mannosyl-transferase
MNASRAHGDRAFLLSVFVLALIVAASALRNGFALDDVHIIVENARVHSLSSFWHLFGQTYWPPEEGASLYRPLTMLAFAVQWVTGGGSPLAFHLFSAVLYALTCAALYMLVAEIASARVALVAGLLFAVHPVHVEVFANVVGQAELWVALLIFVATWWFVRARRRGPLTRSDIAVICALYFSACLFKEHAVVLPAILVAAEIFLIEPSRPLSQRLKALIPVVAALAVVAIGFIALRTAVTGGFKAGGSNELFRDQPFISRLLTMLTVIVEWVRLFIWPADLSADYSFPRTRVATEFSASMLPGILVLGGCAVVAWRMRRENPVVTFALACMLITLAIPSNLFIVTGFVLAERALFLASAGVVILVAIGAVHIWQYSTEKGTTRFAVGSAVALLIAAGGFRSWQRAPVWRDNGTLFRQTVLDVPSSSRAHWMLAEYLSHKVGPRAAVEEMLLAVRLGRPNDPTLLGFAGDQMSMAGLCGQATTLYLRALKVKPDNVQVRVNLTLCLLRLGRIDEARNVASAGPPATMGDPRLKRVQNLADSLTNIRGQKLTAIANSID